MAANTSDLLKKTGASTVTTLSAPGKALSATSITVGSTTNYPTDTGIVVAIRQVDSSGNLVAGTYTEWSATVTSGTTLAIVAVPVFGSDQVYAAGSTTQVYIPLSSYAHNKLIDHLTEEHNQNGTHSAVTATSVSTAALISTGDIQLRSTSLETIRTETEFDYVASGGVWSGDAYGSTLAASMTAITVYINGRRGTVSAVTARAFTASRDTYIDVLNNSGTFSLVYSEVTNNNASPALAANSIRIGIIVTGAGNIAAVGSVNQGQQDKVLPIASSVPYAVTDSLGNLICPRDPNRKMLGYRQILTNFSTTGSNTAVTGLSVPVIVPANRKIKVKVSCNTVSGSNAATNQLIGVWDGTVGSGTQVSFVLVTSGGANYGAPGVAEAILTPSTSSKTYNIGLTNNGGGTSTLYAQAAGPAFVMVELQ